MEAAEDVHESSNVDDRPLDVPREDDSDGTHLSSHVSSFNEEADMEGI